MDQAKILTSRLFVTTAVENRDDLEEVIDLNDLFRE